MKWVGFKTLIPGDITTLFQRCLEILKSMSVSAVDMSKKERKYFLISFTRFPILLLIVVGT
jgi:hypothetical protein